jgi:hypothetical protein
MQTCAVPRRLLPREPRTFAELLIDCEEDPGAAGRVLVGMHMDARNGAAHALLTTERHRMALNGTR